MKRFALAGAPLALLLLFASAASTDAPALKAGVFSPSRPAPDFSLRGSDGRGLTLSRYHGKVIVLSFGYTSCSNVCPITLATLAQARRSLGSLAADLQVVYVTVDPERDSAERMQAYLRSFDATFLGGTGTADELAAVRKQYGILAEKKGSGSDYTIAHSSYTLLIDRSGNVRALMPYGHSAEDYAHDLKILVRE